VLGRLGRDGWELSVLVCGEGEMAGLNSRFRGREGPTDVLSFSQEEGQAFPRGPARRLRGDIAICPGQMRANAARLGVGEDEELRRLIVHGILHLDGMDHGEGEWDGPMLRLQERVLADLAGERVLPSGRAGGEA